MAVISNKEKQKAMLGAMELFKKQYGSSIVSGQQTEEEMVNAVMKVDVISTGSLALDSALGVWGFPRGRIVELYGKEHSGKTSIALQTIGSCQRMGGNALFIDVEHALDPLFALKNGADYSKIHLVRPKSGEEAMDALDFWLKQNIEAGFPLMDVIVVDSVAALATEGQIDSEAGKADVAVGARLLSQMCRKITPFLKGCVVIFINQMRDKPGIIYGAHEETPGGRALKYYSSVRCNVSKTSPLYLTDKNYIVDFEDSKSGSKGKKLHEVGRRVRINIEKNKVAPRGQPAVFDFVADEVTENGRKVQGIIRERELADLALTYKYAEQSGAWISIPGSGEKFQGGDKLSEYFTDPKNEEKLLNYVRNMVLVARRREMETALARIRSKRGVFDMWQEAAAGKATLVGDILDNDDAPPPETDAQEGVILSGATEGQENVVDGEGLENAVRRRGRPGAKS